ncbi:unnamed protein product [Durusdinium trenchii]
MVTIDDVQSPHSVELAEDTSGASEGPSREKAPEELSSVEKIELILAAFDQNGDGRLNFQESNDLQTFASGELIPFEVYKMICDDLRVDAGFGVGAHEMALLYERFGTLERDFQAALRKFNFDPPPVSSSAPFDGGPCQSRLSPWIALPLLPICPVAAGALALGATLWNRGSPSGVPRPGL